MMWFDIFNTRETALLIWLALFLPLAFWFSTTRSLIIGLCKTFLRATTLHKYLLVALSWVALEVWLLWGVGLWSLSNLKGTLLWALTVPMVSTWRIFELSKKENYFGPVLRDTFALTVFVEFLVGFYPLGLVAEFFIVPIASILVLFVEFGKRDKSAQTATCLFEWLLAVLGIFILAHAVMSAIGDFRTLFSFATLVDLIGPIILTLLFLPFLYGVAVYVTYAIAFRRLAFAIKDDGLREYAQAHAILAFLWRLELLRRWSRDMCEGFAESKDGIRRSIREVFASHQHEKNPPHVSLSEGWSPNIARKFLSEHGLSTDDYHRVVSTLNAWWAGSNYLDLDGETLPNNIAYYIDGDETAAKQLKLNLNVNHVDTGENAKRALIEMAERLSEAALDAPVPETTIWAIVSNEDELTLVAGKEVIVQNDPFASERGYEIKFVIRNPGWINEATGPLRIDREKDPDQLGQSEPG